MKNVIDTLGVKNYSDLTQEDLLSSKDLFEETLEGLKEFDNTNADIIEVQDHLKEINQLLK